MKNINHHYTTWIKYMSKSNHNVCYLYNNFSFVYTVCTFLQLWLYIFLPLCNFVTLQPGSHDLNHQQNIMMLCMVWPKMPCSSGCAFMWKVLPNPTWERKPPEGSWIVVRTSYVPARACGFIWIFKHNSRTSKDGTQRLAVPQGFYLLRWLVLPDWLMSQFKWDGKSNNKKERTTCQPDWHCNTAVS